jgi:hypothetical protein
MEFLIMQFSLASCHVIPLRSIYSPQHPVNTLNMCSSLNMRNQVSHPYKATSKIIELYILTSAFLCEDKSFRTSWYQAFPKFSLLLIYS